MSFIEVSTITKARMLINPKSVIALIDETGVEGYDETKSGKSTIFLFGGLSLRMNHSYEDLYAELKEAKNELSNPSANSPME